MTATAVQARLELLRREQSWRRIFRNADRVDAVCFLVSLMSAVDARTGDTFSFEHVREPLEPGEVWLEGNALRCAGWDGPSNARGGTKTWRWQRYIVERLVDVRRTIDLKGRQIGDTWASLATDCAESLLMPGTTSLLYRQREDEAIDNIRRWWTLYTSLPKWVLQRVPAGRKVGPVTVIKPDRSDRPGRDGVTLKFANNAFSDIVPMTSAASSGHGRSTRRIMLDEGGHIEKLLAIRAAVEPAAGQAHIDIISTANGRSNEETGEGNEFHRVWITAEESGYDRLFLGYYLHPDRDDWWYENDPEVQSLPVWKRQEQFPRDEHEAFRLSDRVFFDADALQHYNDHVEKPKYRADIVLDHGNRASVRKRPDGRMRVYREPEAGKGYAIAADVASGHGRDYSAAYVIDLETAEWCVEYHARIAEDEYARDLHFLGKWFNEAIIGVETQGGWGTATVVGLRDGSQGRPPYRRLYRHRNDARADKPSAKAFGYPMDPKNRAIAVNQIEQWVRERNLPFVTDDLLYEMSEFVHHDVGTSPRARDGSRDDRVMAAAGALELFRRYGTTLKRAGRDAARRAAKAKATPTDFNDTRYPPRERV